MDTCAIRWFRVEGRTLFLTRHTHKIDGLATSAVRRGTELIALAVGIASTSVVANDRDHERYRISRLDKFLSFES